MLGQLVEDTCRLWLRALGHYRREYRKLFQEAWLKL